MPNNDSNWHLRDNQRGRDTAFPNTSAGDEPPLTWAARTAGVPEFGVKAANAAINAGARVLGFADGGHVDATSWPPRNNWPGPQRLRHEISPGVPCPSCAVGTTIPIR